MRCINNAESEEYEETKAAYQAIDMYDLNNEQSVRMRRIGV